MPLFQDAISSFRVASRTTKHQPSNQEKLLLWIQEHPEDTHNTTFATVAKRALIPGMTPENIQNAFAALVRSQYIVCTRNGRSNRSKKTFYINYLHAGLPKKVLENAPQEAIEEVKNLTTGKSPEKKKPTEKKPLESEVTIPVDKSSIEKGLSLTLNINFTIK